MGRDPAFMFYSKDWIVGTAEMMPDEKGVYIDLLAYQHQKGVLPCETTTLAKMVGLSHDQFMRIWETISVKFDHVDNHLVNQRLSTIITERALSAKKKRIAGTFASVLRKLKLSYSEKKISSLRSDFKADDFIEFPETDIESEITKWCTKWLTK